jgi:hypothetical protein
MPLGMPLPQVRRLERLVRARNLEIVSRVPERQEMAYESCAVGCHCRCCLGDRMVHWGFEHCFCRSGHSDTDRNHRSVPDLKVRGSTR